MVALRGVHEPGHVPGRARRRRRRRAAPPGRAAPRDRARVVVSGQSIAVGNRSEPAPPAARRLATARPRVEPDLQLRRGRLADAGAEVHAHLKLGHLAAAEGDDGRAPAVRGRRGRWPEQVGEIGTLGGGAGYVGVARPPDLDAMFRGLTSARAPRRRGALGRRGRGGRATCAGANRRRRRARSRSPTASRSASSARLRGSEANARRHCASRHKTATPARGGGARPRLPRQLHRRDR